MFLLSRSVEKRPIRLSLEIEAVIHTHWHSRKVGYNQIWETVKMISPMQEGESRIRRMQRRIQTGLRTQGVLHMREPPSKIWMGSHQAVALQIRWWHRKSYTCYPYSCHPILQSHTKALNFGNVIMPLTPLTPTHLTFTM